MRGLIVVALGVTGCFSKPPAPALDDGGSTTSGTYRRAISLIASPTVDLVSFPVNISLRDDAALKSHRPRVDQIAILDANGDRLPAEVTGFSPELGMLDVWVILPVFKSSTVSRELTLVYGDSVVPAPAEPIWPPTDWRGVWHLDDTLSGEARDSSGHALTLSATAPGGAPMPRAEGIAGYGLGYPADASSELCRSAGEPYLEVGTSSFTIELWVRPIAFRGDYDMALWKGASNGTLAGYDFELGLNQWNAFVRDGTGQFFIATLASDGMAYLGTWSHLAVVVDRARGTTTPYFNGAPQLDVGIPAGTLTGTSRFCLGESNRPMTGELDEVRLHAVARSPAWMRSSYLNLAQRDQFMTIGDEISP